MKSEARHILVIGFPFSLCTSVIKQLGQSKKDSVSILCQKQNARRATYLASQIPCRCQVIKGDYHKIDFGLTGDDYLNLASSVTHIVGLPLQALTHEVEKAPGVAALAHEIVEFGLVAEQLKQIIVLSHFDVLGNFTGVFAEKDFSVGQSFETPISRYRFQAEKIYRTLGFELPIVIIRIGDIVGNPKDCCPLVHLLVSEPELTQKYQHLELPIAMADNVSTVIVSLLTKLKSASKITLHLTPTQSLTTQVLYQWIMEVADNVVPGGFQLSHGAQRALHSKKEFFGQNGKEFFGNWFGRGKVESSWTESLLAELGIQQPMVGETEINEIAKLALEEIVGLR